MRWTSSLLAVLSVLVFFGGIEVLLWLAGAPTIAAQRDPFQGFSERVRVYRLDEARDVYRTPKAARQSFNDQEFRARKPENGFRFFVLGGSSAYGFPWGAEDSFTRHLGVALAASHPERSIESINAGAMSYASHRLRILTHELLDLEPDLLVIYGGHNEFAEPHFYQKLLDRPRATDAIRVVLHQSRLYTAMTQLYLRGAEDAPAASEDSALATPLDLHVARSPALNVTEAERESVRTRFEENLRAILDMTEEAGVAVVLCTVPSNLREWVPNQSAFGIGVSPLERQEVLRLLAAARARLAREEAAEAAAVLERALRVSPDYAEIHFELGRAYEALERWDEASAAYVRARDTDANPWRAPSSLNETIRRVGAERGVPVVDVERVFAEESPHGLVGFDLMEDYVHPNREAHRRIALELWSAIEGEGFLGEARRADAASFWKALEDAKGPEATIDSSEARLRTARLLYNTGVVLLNQERLEEAAEKFREAIELSPRYTSARANLGYLLLMDKRFSEAAQQFRAVLEITPGHIESLVGLGSVQFANGNIEGSVATLRRATQLDPQAPRAWYGLGVAVRRQGAIGEAEAAFARAVALAPEDVDARFQLGTVLQGRGRLDEALQHYRAAQRSDPRRQDVQNAIARLQRMRSSQKAK